MAAFWSRVGSRLRSIGQTAATGATGANLGPDYVEEVHWLLRRVNATVVQESVGNEIEIVAAFRGG